MPNYMLLLHESPADFAGLSPEQIQRVIAEYTSWRDKVKSEGRFVGSAKLKDEGGKHMSGGNGNLRVTDGPFTEAKELIGGYFAISADDYDQAVETASSCPHLKYGGRIEVREIEFSS